MKIQSLTAKLEKMGIAFKVVDLNGYNKDLIFSINGKEFKASFDADKEKVYVFCYEKEFDQINQETSRAFFSTLSGVVKFAS